MIIFHGYSKILYNTPLNIRLIEEIIETQDCGTSLMLFSQAEIFFNVYSINLIFRVFFL